MMLTYMCFRQGSIDGDLIADLLEDPGVGFDLTRIRTNELRSGGPGAAGAIYDRLRRHGPLSSMEVVGDGGSISLSGLGGFQGQVLLLETESWPSERLIEAAMRLQGFVLAVAGDREDVFWQSVEQTNVYEAFGRSWDGLPTIQDEVFGGVKLDVSANPGRRVALPAMWLWIGAKVWFGAEAMTIIDRERILSLPVGTVDVRPEGAIVRFYEVDAPIESVRRIQQGARDWLEFDEIESRSSELAALYNDPKVEVETGVFPHGGVMRVTEWLTDDRLTPRSKAKQARIVELDPSGAVVRRETRDV